MARIPSLKNPQAQAQIEALAKHLAEAESANLIKLTVIVRCASGNIKDTKTGIGAALAAGQIYGTIKSYVSGPDVITVEDESGNSDVFDIRDFNGAQCSLNVGVDMAAQFGFQFNNLPRNPQGGGQACEITFFCESDVWDVNDNATPQLKGQIETAADGSFILSAPTGKKLSNVAALKEQLQAKKKASSDYMASRRTMVNQLMTGQSMVQPPAPQVDTTAQVDLDALAGTM